MGMALALNHRGNIALAQLRMEDACVFYEESLALFRLLKHGVGIAALLHNLGRIASDCGDEIEARRYLGESMSRCREMKDSAGIVENLDGFARLLFLEKRFQ